MSEELTLPGQRLWSHGTLFQQQRAALLPYVRGKEVFDIGSGMLAMARALVMMGAEHVHAVDPIYRSTFDNLLNHNRPWDGGPKVTLHAMPLLEFNGWFSGRYKTASVTFLSWPANHNIPGMAWFVRRSECVVYLGKNTDGTACGGDDLFAELRKREVLVHEPFPENTLIVYGSAKKRRRQLPEEIAQASKKKALDYEVVHRRYDRRTTA